MSDRFFGAVMGFLVGIVACVFLGFAYVVVMAYPISGSIAIVVVGGSSFIGYKMQEKK